jgi:hypothetical protein
MEPNYNKSDPSESGGDVTLSKEGEGGLCSAVIVSGVNCSFSVL